MITAGSNFHVICTNPRFTLGGRRKPLLPFIPRLDSRSLVHSLLVRLHVDSTFWNPCRSALRRAEAAKLRRQQEQQYPVVIVASGYTRAGPIPAGDKIGANGGVSLSADARSPDPTVPGKDSPFQRLPRESKNPKKGRS